MRTPSFCRAAGLLVAGAVAVLAPLDGARADLVYLPDGFTLQGRVRRESTSITDPSGQIIVLAKLNGFYLVDDGARRVVFPGSQVQDVDDRYSYDIGNWVSLRRIQPRPFRPLTYPIVRIYDITPWNRDGQRVLRFDTLIQGQTHRITADQRLTELTPYYARVDTINYNWSSFYLTRELGPEAVRKLLAQHPDLKEKGDKTDAIKRWVLFRFLVQAGWYDAAEQELDRIQKDKLDGDDKIEEARTNLRKARTQQLFEEIELARKAGRHRWAMRQLDAFPLKGTDDRLLTRIRRHKAEYDIALGNVVEAQRLLKVLPPRLAAGPERALFTEALDTIVKELHPDNVQRLDTFLRLARQAERRQQQGSKPDQGPGELASLAVTGWLLGNSSSEASVPVARRLWETRRFVLELQKTHNEANRQQLLTNYQNQKGSAVPFDELAQLIRFLPPPEPEEKLGTTPVELRTKLPESKGEPQTYVVQLPPEYTHSRPYPVLFVLHQAGQKPSDMLELWSDLAARHGYILVAPSWGDSLGNEGYNFTGESHAAVVDVLRDLRRRFQVDSDRVFLFGFGEGGNMAFDVGLSHPDLFAGVIPMAARPRLFARKYWCNAQYLPFYVVGGDRESQSPEDIRREFEHWVPHGYPTLYVAYRGRGAEWFAGELPTIFDWMDRKKRAEAFPDLGKAGNGGPFGEEFQTMRQTDNHFYWLSTTGLHDRHVNDPARWNALAVSAAMQARIGEANAITVNVRGLKQVTVWLGNGMVDFDKPVYIRVQPYNLIVNRLIRPDLGTLLEDFYQRGDRQRLFLARVDFNLR
jgi:pimeloyl-ACP methyl ester carboxylesterase